MSSKEIRYRWLLALYPGDFRGEYGDEMLGVLLADPGPVSQHAASLVAGATAARLRQLLAGSEWRRAALAMQLFGALLLAAIPLRRMVVTSTPAGWDEADVIRAVAWTAVAVAALFGLRALAVPSALVGLGAEIAAPLRFYLDTPARFLNAYWIVVTAAIVLVCALFARGRRPRGWALVAAAAVALVIGGEQMIWVSAEQRVVLLPGGPVTLLVMAGLLTIALIRIDRALRRRLLALAVPVLMAPILVESAFGGFVEHNSLHPEDLWLIGPGQWAVLVLAPVVAFLIAAAVVRRFERPVSTAPVPEI